MSFTMSAQNWTRKSDFIGDNRYDAISFAINGYGYLGLGYDGVNNFNDFFRYNPNTNQWDTISNFPSTARRAAIAFVIDSIAYVGLGWSSTPTANTYSDIYKYDPINDLWDTIASYPGNGGRNSMAASCRGKGYVFGGAYNYNTPYSNQMWEYNPASNQWSRMSNPPFGSRTNGTMFSIDTLIYVGLGHTTSQGYNDFWEFNPTLNTWRQIASLPGLSRLQAKAFIVDGKAVVGGGHRFGQGATSTLNDYYIFDPSYGAFGAWDTISDFSRSRRGAYSTFTINDIGYIACGRDSSSSELNDLWSFQLNNTTVSLVNEAFDKLEFQIYPNPVSENLIFLSSYKNPILIRIKNMSGQVISELLSNEQNNEIFVGDLASGVYILEASDNLQLTRLKFIKH